jgi:phosphoglycerate kinase
MDKLTVRDLDAHDKRVLVRVDFNVPLEDGRVTDDSRVRASLPTIRYLMAQGARIILVSHLGRPDGKVQDGLRLRPVGERLSRLLGRNVPVTGDALGLGTEDAMKRLRPGEVLLLENLRFHPEEEANDPKFAATLASYADVYVNDAFGTAHRAHASTVGVAKLLPAYAGLLMEREIAALSKLLDDPEHPFVAIVGGAKVSGKLKVLDNLLSKVDRLILGGGMANTFLLAQGRSVGKSLAEHDMVDEARRVMADAQRKGVQVILPVDVIVAKEVTRGTEYKTLPAEKIPASWHIVDVGRQTMINIENALADVRTVVWNGPIGVFEIPVFGAGTRHVARILAEKAEAGATVIVGGGDSVAAVQQQGLAAKMTHLSTGGGASLEFLEGRVLPGISVLLDRPKVGQAPPRPEAASAPAPKVEGGPRFEAVPRVEGGPRFESAPRVEGGPRFDAPPKVESAPKLEARPKATVTAQANSKPVTKPKSVTKPVTKPKSVTKAVIKPPVAKAKPAKPKLIPKARPVAKEKPAVGTRHRPVAKAKPAAEIRAKPVTLRKPPSKPKPVARTRRAARAKAKVTARPKPLTKPKPSAKAKPQPAARPKLAAKAKSAMRARPTAKARPAATAKPAAKAKPSTKPTSAAKGKSAAQARPKSRPATQDRPKAKANPAVRPRPRR